MKLSKDFKIFSKPFLVSLGFVFLVEGFSCWVLRVTFDYLALQFLAADLVVMSLTSCLKPSTLGRLLGLSSNFVFGDFSTLSTPLCTSSWSAQSFY